MIKIRKLLLLFVFLLSISLVYAYPWHHYIYTTQFYIGEPGSGGSTAWDIDAVNSYGGIDDPINRNNYYPADFIPNENPFYFALPYSDLNSYGDRRLTARFLPWYDYKLDKTGYSFVKNKWIEAKRLGRTCYAQWEDCIPNCSKFRYVFKNKKYRKIPGLDISPALSDCLGMDDPEDPIFGHRDGFVSWRFIDEEDVPNGPWKEIITISQVNW